MVCAYSTKVPARFKCDEEGFEFSVVPTSSAPSSAATPSPTAPPYKAAPVVVRLTVDIDPTDISWRIQTTGANPKIMVEIPPGTYTSSYATYFKQIDVLRPDTEYDFVFFDACIGGLNGIIAIFLGSEPLDGKILAKADLYDIGPFNRFDLRFNTSLNATRLGLSLTPSQAPSTSLSQTSISPSPTFNHTWIIVRFRTYMDSRTTGWRLVTSSDEIVHEEYPGFFRGNEPVFLKSLQVNAGGKFKLVITDTEGLGFRGEAIVFIGTVMDDSTVVAYYNGETDTFGGFPTWASYGYFSTYTMPFTASSNATIDYRAPISAPIAPQIEPSEPSVSAAPIGALVNVVVTVLTDLFPLDTGWSILKTNGEVVWLVDTGSYQNSLFQYRTDLMLSYDEFYVLAIMDNTCDGMGGEVSVYIGNNTEPRYLLASFNETLWTPYLTIWNRCKSLINFQVKLYDFNNPQQNPTSSPQTMPNNDRASNAYTAGYALPWVAFKSILLIVFAW